MQRSLWQSQKKKSPAATLQPSAKLQSVKTPMGWTSPDSDANALLLASVLPSKPPSLLMHGVRALRRFGLAVWSVRTGDVLPWFGSLRPGVRWALVACVTITPVLGFYQSVASSAATRTTQALTPAPAPPASVETPQALAQVEPTSLPAAAELPREQAQPAEPPSSEAAAVEEAAGLEEQAPPNPEPAPQAHKHRKSSKKAKARATKHTTKASSRRQHSKPDA